jgi:gas vesicle protein
MTAMENKNDFGYFLLGIGMGVAAGLLWAPRSGDQTRQVLAEKAGEGVDYLQTSAQDGVEFVHQQTGNIKHSATTLYNKGATTIAAQKETLKAVVEAGKQAYHDAAQYANVAAVNHGD